MCRNRFGAEEAEIIVRLNTISPDWRDIFDTTEQAANYLLPRTRQAADDSEGEMNFETLGFGADDYDE